MKHLLAALVVCEVLLFLCALGYALYGIFWWKLTPLCQALFCYLLADKLFPALIRTINGPEV